jgi:hypothetical protein
VRCAARWELGSSALRRTAREMTRSPAPARRQGFRRSWTCTACGAYITHLVKFDYPERFVAEQAGNRDASTTALGVSDDYRNRLVRRSLETRPEYYSCSFCWSVAGSFTGSCFDPTTWLRGWCRQPRCYTVRWTPRLVQT